MRKALIISIWAIAFAFVEASVVEYLRAIYYPLSSGGFQFPALTLEFIQRMGLEHTQRLKIEVVRELCTLIMLVAVGMIAARNRREAWAYFMIAFGVWDIFYYVWLKIFLDWPAGMMTWDLLFLVPVPWVAPVLAPVIISIALIVSGLTVLFFEGKNEPLALQWRDWILLVTGGIISHHILLLGLPKYYGRRISTPFSMDCILSWFGRIFYNFFDGGPQAAALGKSGFNA